MEEWLFCVKGRVQGVGYRASVLHFVHDNFPEMRGYVKNLPNGNVEVLAQGSILELEFLLSFLKEGPRISRVSEVLISKSKTLSDVSTFSVAY